MLERRRGNSDSYINLFVDTSPNCIVVINDNRMIYVNRTFLNFLGYQSVEALLQAHHCISDFFLPSTKKLFATTLSSTTTWIDYIIQRPQQNHYIQMEKDGNVHTFRVYIGKLDFHESILYSVIFNDITELEAEKERYKQAIEGSNVGLWDWDLKNNTLYFSKRWKEMLGFNDEELPNEFASWQDRVHSDDLPIALENIRANLAGETPFYECTHRLRHKNGSWVWISDRGKTYFNDEGEAIRMVGSHTDVTQIHETLEKLELQQQEIQHKDKLMLAQSRNAAMGEMINMIAHQWRQPVSVLAMSINNILLDIDLGTATMDDIEKQLRDMLLQTEHISQTIDDFRNFFKSDKNKEFISIKNILNNSLKLVQKSFESKLITLKLDIHGDCVLEIYSRELLQVLLNILKNAQEALEHIDPLKRCINIVLAQTENEAIITICDNAGGIKEDAIDKIFEPYFSTKMEKNGTGLGLYMSKIIVEKHLCGELRAYNSHEGACFEIKLPKSNVA